MNLYAYGYPEEMLNAVLLNKPFKVKIGQTKLTAEGRVEEQTRHESNSEDAILLWKKKLTGLVNTDRQVHEFLDSFGGTRVQRDKKRSTEWFAFVAPADLRDKAAETSANDNMAVFTKGVEVFVSAYMERALAHIEAALKPADVVTEIKTEIKEVVKYMSPTMLKLDGLRHWYDSEVKSQDMMFMSSEKNNQPHVMSFDLARKVIGKADAAPARSLKVLVIEAIELVDCLVKLGYHESCIQYVSSTEAKRDAVEERYGCPTMNGTVLINRYRKMKRQNKEFKMSKFDVCWMNPPYELGMHVDFLNIAIDVADQVVCVAPSTWAINRKPTERKGEELELVETAKKIGCSIELTDGMGMFANAEIEAPLAITHMNKLEQCEKIMFNGEMIDFDRITVAGAWAARFLDMIQDDNMWSHANRNAFSSFAGVTVSEGAWYVNQCWKRGGHGYTYDDFYTLFPADKVPENNRADNTGWVSWAFDTEQEALNLINYGKTKFVRFMLSMYKMNGNIHAGELAAIPWMDFTQEWNDEKLCKHFGVTAEEWEKINAFIPDYY